MFQTSKKIMVYSNIKNTVYASLVLHYWGELALKCTVAVIILKHKSCIDYPRFQNHLGKR